MVKKKTDLELVRVGFREEVAFKISGDFLNLVLARSKPHSTSPSSDALIKPHV